MTEVVEISEISDLVAYAAVWKTLFARMPRATFFQTLQWLCAYWKNFGADQRLRVLIVHAGGEPIGILPLVVRREQTRLGSFRVLTYPLADWGSFYGPIGADGAATLALGLRYIAQTRRDWDLLDLRWVEMDAVDRGRTENAFRLAGMSTLVTPWKEISMVDLPNSWEDYLESRKSKFRQNVRRLIRRGETSGITFHRFRPEASPNGSMEESWSLLEDCMQLAARSWQGSSETGTTLSHASVRDFFHDSHEAATRLGMLDIGYLKQDGRMIAFGYKYHHQGEIQAMRVGHDPDLQNLGLGTLQYAHGLMDSISLGERRLDLGPNHLETKAGWRTSLAMSYRICHHSQWMLRAQALRLHRWLKFRRNPTPESLE
ncbi:GNAT family N-acetyltransferase [Blastopirellula sp. JC732]|uniref:GNAT family N-acetyltransferase n=1 Tax=Blastopirellula sediminis TaxID=2894196 RepID=A0A9X1SEI5_9BACT|nr:GNAT family N-acetyltransferase [Blastopirellula sediminis]MCC9609328.1 GNAT family N-acetyltransferase [Blastopirellula sediminis]MCC9627895.1 GNAT family N-acetyltransferase [Blastopirellula sediminis]